MPAALAVASTALIRPVTPLSKPAKSPRVATLFQLTVIIAGSGKHGQVTKADAIAAQAAQLAGVARVLTIENPANEHALAAVLAPQVVALAAKDYSHVLVASTTFGKDLMPRVAALLGTAQISDIMAGLMLIAWANLPLS